MVVGVSNLYLSNTIQFEFRIVVFVLQNADKVQFIILNKIIRYVIHSTGQPGEVVVKYEH